MYSENMIAHCSYKRNNIILVTSFASLIHHEMKIWNKAGSMYIQNIKIMKRHSLTYNFFKIMSEIQNELTRRIISLRASFFSWSISRACSSEILRSSPPFCLFAAISFSKSTSSFFLILLSSDVSFRKRVLSASCSFLASSLASIKYWRMTFGW